MANKKELRVRLDSDIVENIKLMALTHDLYISDMVQICIERFLTKKAKRVNKIKKGQGLYDVSRDVLIR